MRYYKPEKTELVKGFICEMYDDDTYEWSEITVANPRAIRAIWHDGDIRVKYLDELDFLDLGMNLSFKHLGGNEVIIGFDENDEEITEIQEQYSTEEADIIFEGKKIGKFYVYQPPIDGVLQPNVMLRGKMFIVKNKYELAKILENE